jgi:3-oxoadipate enol-lactonase
MPISANGLYYEITGEGHPLVLIHSALMNNKMWEDQVEAFAKYYKVIRYDMRGFGKSPMQPTPDTHDLRDLLRSLNINSAYVLGLSLGAEIAMYFAFEFPEMVDALILVGSGLEGYDYSTVAARNWEGFISIVRKRNFPRAIEEFIRLNVDGPVVAADTALREKIRGIMSEYSFVHYLPRDSNEPPHPPADEPAAEQIFVPAIERLGEIKMPALIMVGGNDQPDCIDIASILTMGIPKAKQVTIPGAAHIVNMQKPEAFNSAVLDFLKEVDQNK